MNETQAMLDTIKRKGVTNKKILDAMSQINRSLFVTQSTKNLAYSDLALPIGQAQTISQPYIVAKMLELLDPQPSDKILEIGSGSGYVAAILSKLSKKIIAIEINEELAKKSKETITKLKIPNIRILNQDGSEGYLPGYPYDKIIISAATPNITKQLIEQLQPQGTIIAPVGDRMHQTLTKITKNNKEITQTQHDKVMFVPLKGKKGF